MARYRWTRSLYRSLLGLAAGLAATFGGCASYGRAQEAAPAFVFKVAGLELPAPVEIDHKPGKLVRVPAKADAKVSFIVKTSPAMDLDTTSDGKVLSFPMPPPGTEVLVIAAVNGKDAPTFAETLITIKGGDGPRPPPDNPVAGDKAKNATLLLDFEALTPDLAAFRESGSLKKKAEALGVKFRVLNVQSQAAQDLGFTDLYRQAKGAALVLQSTKPGKAGIVAVYSVKPSKGNAAANEQALLDLIAKHAQ